MKSLHSILFLFLFLYSTNLSGQDTTFNFRIEIPIQSENSDVEELNDGTIYQNSTDLELVDDPNNGGIQIVGMHFEDLLIGRGATVNQAYIQFTVDEVSVGSCALQLSAEATDHASIFTTEPFSLSNASKTNASINWTPENWQTLDESGEQQQTPDLSAVIQELIDQPEWRSGNSINIFVEGNGRRTAYSYENDPDSSPKLIVEGAIPLLTDNLSDIYINELMANNSVVLDEYGEADDWVELYNDNDLGVLLQNLYLSDDPAQPLKWKIEAPLYIGPKSFSIFWLDDAADQGSNHLPFKLSSSGESVILSQMQGADLVTLDEITFPSLQENVSYGRETDGSSSWVTFGAHTPNSSNNGSGLYFDATVDFSIPSGFYSNGTTLSLSCSDIEAEIRYTLNGSPPNSNSPLYNNLIPLLRTTQVTAAAFKPGYVTNNSASEFYLIDGDHELPVVQISVDPKHLWDDEEGIYVSGSKGITGNCSNDTPRNWNQDWRRPVHIQYFEPDGDLAFDATAEMKIGGGCSRGYAAKGLNFFLDDKVEYPLFQQLPYDEYKRFKLRVSGNDFIQTRIRDASIQTMLANQVDIDLMAYEPVVVYLNHEYWGFYGMREFFNQHYLETHHGIDKDSVDIIKNPYQWTDVKEGDRLDWDDLTNFVETNSFQNLDNYNELANRIDINEFMNYHIAQIYIGNYDFPGNNVAVWRDKRKGGKWRWMLYDLDISSNFGSWSPTVSSYNMISHMTATNGPTWPNPPEATLFFRKIIQNQYFEYEFTQRLCTFGQVLFEKNRAEGIIDSLAGQVASEVPDFIEKFTNTPQDWSMWRDAPVGGNQGSWRNNLNTFKDFFSERIGYILSNFRNHFDYSGNFNLAINFDANSHGKVVFHTNEMEIPYNYSGYYFQNIPIRIKAIPEDGYYFSHWLENGNTNSIIDFRATNDTELTPIFYLIGTNSISELEAPSFIHVSPNPAKISLKIDYQLHFPEDFTIQFFNALGNKILEKDIRMNNASTSINIDVSDWHEGIYFLKSKIGTREVLKKIVIQ